SAPSTQAGQAQASTCCSCVKGEKKRPWFCLSNHTHTPKTRLGALLLWQPTSLKPLWCLCARTRTEAGLALHTDCAAREMLCGDEGLLPPGLPALECCASVCVVFCAPFPRGLALPSRPLCICLYLLL
ncbi:unnamed protein product, partial [Ectocarpus sp. 4 AP-2014]